MNKFLIGVYKEVGKEPELKKVKNTFEDIKQLIGGEIESIKYEDFIILYKKNSNNLMPNIWINTGFLKIGTTIRGNVFVIGKDKKGNFISLNKNQFLKCIKLLINESFNYKTNNKKTKYIDKRNYNQNLNQYKVQENKLSNNDISKELILKILFTILDFVKNKMN